MVWFVSTVLEFYRHLFRIERKPFLIFFYFYLFWKIDGGAAWTLNAADDASLLFILNALLHALAGATAINLVL